MRPSLANVISALIILVAFSGSAIADDHTSAPRPSTVAPAEVGVVFSPNSTTTVIVQRDGKSYVVDLVSKTITEMPQEQAQESAQQSSSSSKTATQETAGQQDASDQAADALDKKIYRVGDDRLFTLPTGQRMKRGSFSFNFTHRFPYESAFQGPARGNTLLGLDDFAIPSFGFTYSITNRVAVSAFRSPSIIARPIQLMASVSMLDEHDHQPFNAQLRFAIEGQNDFQRNFITSFELITSKSITHRAQLYFVPEVSIHNRPVLGQSSITSAPPYQPCGAPLAAGAGALRIRPCANTAALGFGLSVDVRPTVALIAEVDPTVMNAAELGIHRPAYSFAIQKKIFRHAFTFGFTNAVGVTVAERSATRAVYLKDPSADKPSGMFVGFNLSRQIR